MGKGLAGQWVRAVLAGWLLACLAGWELEIGGLGLAWLMAWGRAGWLELAGWLGLAGWG